MRRQAVGIDPDNGMAQYFLSEAYNESGERQWERALSLMNEDIKTVEDLRRQVIHFAQNNFDTNLNDRNTIIKWSALHRKENIASKVQNLFTKGGIVLQTQ